MRKGEFRYFLDGYKKVNEIAKKIIEEKFKDWDYMSFSIKDGKIWATIWSGEDASDIPDALQDRDITKEVLAGLMPDDLIF